MFVDCQYFSNLILDEKCQSLLMFSIYTNGKKLFMCEHTQSPNNIQCLYGIRSITSFWIIAGHTPTTLCPRREQLEYTKVNIQHLTIDKLCSTFEFIDSYA